MAALQGRERVTLEQATPVLDVLATSLPDDLRGRTRADLARLWPAWVERHDREVRARLARGDEDSLVNFWLYGTSFTSLLPAIARGGRSGGPLFDDLVARRLEDLLDRAIVPGDNERLQFAERIFLQRDADPATSAGRERARRLLSDARQRMIREFAETDRTLDAARRDGASALAGANATIFKSRGLSSDTSVLSDYGVHLALESIARQRTLEEGSVRRVAIVGPGLDFTNKADGYDYYPQQTIQPFALIDALRRARLAAPELRVTTFDISARVNAHLQRIVAGAPAQPGYVVTLPLDGEEGWTGEVLRYWQQWGSTIGDEMAGPPPPAAASIVKTRTIRVRPAVVSAVSPLDLNIVVDRLMLPDAERFDLIVATNVLLYYGPFEQALAAANITAMLRPGGVFVTNTAVLPTPPLRAAASYLRVPQTAERYDDIYWYQRD